MAALTYRTFQEQNADRCNSGVFGGHTVEDWPVQNWALAIAGEAGELCNLVKKALRGDFPLEEKRQEILEEIADVITYCDLLMSRLGADTATEVRRKFDIVSQRVGYPTCVAGIEAPTFAVKDILSPRSEK